MKLTTRAAAATLLAAGLLAVATAPAQTPPQQDRVPDTGAHGPGGAGPGWGPHGPMDRGGGPGGPGGPPRFGPPMGPGHGPGPMGGRFSRGLLDPPPFITGLHLTQEQQDKVFSILYAAAPRRRDQDKALRAAREALMKAGTAENFDETAVRREADAAAKAQSELTLLRMRTDHQIYEVLTPQQRAQMEQRRKQHGPGNPPPV